jgi:O-antigen ligase
MLWSALEHSAYMTQPIASPIAAGGAGTRYTGGPGPAPRPLPWDALQVALMVLVSLQVWRVHELFPSLAIHGLPILMTVIALTLLLLGRDPRRRLSALNHPVVRAAVGILALAALSVPGSLYPSRSLNFLLKDYSRTVLLMVLVAASVRGFADLRRYAWLQLGGVTLFAAVIVGRAQMGADGRLRDLAYYDVNDLAMLIVCSLPLVLYLWRRPAHAWARVVLAAATVFLLVALGKTGSRGGFLGFVAVGGYLLLRLRGVSTLQRIGTVALLATLLGTVASDKYFDRIETIFHPSADYNWSGKSETGRMEIWKRGMGYMLDHPLLGVGAAAFPVAEGTLAPEALEQRRYGRGFKWSAPHNSFVQVGAELGIGGLILFVALLAAAFGTLARLRRVRVPEIAVVAQVFTASLVAFVVTASFLSQAYSAYLYTLLGMILGLAKIVSLAQPPVPARAPMPRPVG